MPFTSLWGEDPEEEQFHIASQDYPELEEILEERHPYPNTAKVAAKQTDARCSLCNMNPVAHDVGGMTVCDSCLQNQLGVPLDEDKYPVEFGQARFGSHENEKDASLEKIACARCNGSGEEPYGRRKCLVCEGSGLAEREAGFFTWIKDQLTPKGIEPGIGGQWSYDWCYLPDAPVLMADGTEKPISQIQAGDEVITHTGMVRKVTWVGCRPFEGELTHIKVQGDTSRIVTATSQHKMWAANSHWGLEGRRKEYIQRYTGSRDTVLDPQQDWMAIGDLQVGDYLSRSIMVEEIPVVKIYDCPVRSWDANYCQQFEVKIDEEIAWLLGYYAGDGHCQKKRGYDVWFEVGTDGGPITNRLLAIAQNYFGVEGSVIYYADRNASKVRVAHWALNKLVAEMIGDGSMDKTIHQDIMTLPLSEQRAFIEGYRDADGHEGQDGRSIISSISMMPYQIREILARMGICANINPDIPTQGFDNAKESRRVIWYKGKQKKVSHFIRDNCVWQRITEVKKSHYEGWVWDIEVEEDHSFRAFSMNTHNCRFRRNSHCYFPEKLDTAATAQAGYAVWVPKDRGMCPRMKWIDQENCPISQPGPHSGDKHSLTDATVPWSQGGQHGGTPSKTDYFLPKHSSYEDPIDFSSEAKIDKIATYWDVQQKAKRLRQEGRVKLLETPQEGLPYLYAHVRGDNGDYHIVFERNGFKIASWICDCTWGDFGPDGPLAAMRAPNSPYKNRKCSHVLAAAYELQSREVKQNLQKGSKLEPFVVQDDDGEQHTIIHLENDILVSDMGHLLHADDVKHPDYDSNTGLDK